MTNAYDASVAVLDVAFTTCQDIMYTDFQPISLRDASVTPGAVAGYREPWRPVNVYFKRALVYALYRQNSSYLPKHCNLRVLTNVTSLRVTLAVITGELSIDFMDVVSLGACCGCCIHLSFLIPYLFCVIAPCA